MKYLIVIMIGALLFASGYIYLENKASRSIRQVPILADWDEGLDVTPKSKEELKASWIMEGEWALESGKLVTKSDINHNKILLFKKPITGSLAFEFRARIKDQKAFDEGRDLSVILLSSKDLLRRYDLQVLGGNDKIKSKAIIQMIDIPLAEKDVGIEIGKDYLIRGEVEGDSLRLYVNSKLIVETHNKYFLNGAFHGIYSYGGGKEFWDLKFYRKFKGYHANPLKMADLHLNNALACPFPNNNFFNQARESYKNLLHHSEYKNKKEVILLRLAVVEKESNNLEALGSVLKEYFENYSSYQAKSFQIELALLQNHEKEALVFLDQFLNGYSDHVLELMGSIKKILLSKLSIKFSQETRSRLWNVFLDVTKTKVINAKSLAISNLDFLKNRSISSIRLGGNEIEDISAISSIADLGVLQLPRNKVRDISALSKMNFSQLILDENPVLDLSPLAGSKIKSLFLRDMKTTDFLPIAEIVGLKDLSVSGCPIKDFSFLKHLELKSLFLRDLELNDLSSVNKKTLIELRCGLNEIKSIAAADFPNLKRLVIEDNQLTSLEEVAKIPLDFLFVDGNPIKSLKPYYKNPPKGFSFNCQSISKAELKTAISHWEGNEEAKSSLYLAKMYLALRESDAELGNIKKHAIKSEDGHLYAFVPKEMTWLDANTFCIKRKGHLVSITSKEENSFIQNLPGMHMNAWIGLQHYEGAMQWANGEPFYYANFDIAQTNIGYSDGHYLIEKTSYTSPWRKIGKNSGVKNAFIIEWEK